SWLERVADNDEVGGSSPPSPTNERLRGAHRASGVRLFPFLGEVRSSRPSYRPRGSSRGYGHSPAKTSRRAPMVSSTLNVALPRCTVRTIVCPISLFLISASRS